MRRAVFLDRDGVINEHRADHVKSWADFRFLPGSAEAIGRLSRADHRVFVVTNQAIVNRGMVSHQVVDDINQRMLDELARRGGRVEGVAYCPHRPDEGCACRKPRPGLLLKLAHEFDLDLKAAVLIGDTLADIEAGLSAGCQTMLVLTGRGREQQTRAAATGVDGFLVADDLSAAADYLLNAP
jgi:D-glycero-D-manno-heptose 1,7-bisphosphate phosphatase